AVSTQFMKSIVLKAEEPAGGGIPCNASVNHRDLFSGHHGPRHQRHFRQFWRCDWRRRLLAEGGKLLHLAGGELMRGHSYTLLWVASIAFIALIGPAAAQDTKRIRESPFAGDYVGKFTFKASH